MTHYWGVNAIMERLDISAHRTLFRWIATQGLPVLRRHVPGKLRPQLYSNEGLILLWELAQARAYLETLKGSRPAPPPHDAPPPSA